MPEDHPRAHSTMLAGGASLTTWQDTKLQDLKVPKPEDEGLSIGACQD